MAAQLVLSRDNLIEYTKGTISDLEYRLKNARSPMSKRSLKRSLEYLEAVLYYLETYKQP